MLDRAQAEREVRQALQNYILTGQTGAVIGCYRRNLFMRCNGHSRDFDIKRLSVEQLTDEWLAFCAAARQPYHVSLLAGPRKQLSFSSAG